jgi:hypothetical protein
MVITRFGTNSTEKFNYRAYNGILHNINMRIIPKADSAKVLIIHIITFHLSIGAGLIYNIKAGLYKNWGVL